MKKSLISVLFLGIFCGGCSNIGNSAIRMLYIDKKILLSNQTNQVYFNGNFNSFTNTISIKIDSVHTLQSTLTQEIKKSGFDLIIFESKHCSARIKNNKLFSINTKVITSNDSELYGILKSKDDKILFYIKYDSKSGHGIALDNQERCFEIT